MFGFKSNEEKKEINEKALQKYLSGNDKFHISQLSKIRMANKEDILVSRDDADKIKIAIKNGDKLIDVVVYDYGVLEYPSWMYVTAGRERIYFTQQKATIQLINVVIVNEFF